MAITAEQVKALREKTGVGMMECKKALTEADGDMDRALTLLRERGLAAAAKKASRPTREGIIGEYVHTGGKLGVLVEVNCETDFVARTDQFQQLIRDIAMQIAAHHPLFVSREEIGEEILSKEKEIYRKQALTAGKPEAVVDKIVEGKLNKYYAQVCLYEQPFIKEPEHTVQELIASKVAILKENITVRRFARFKVGESSE